MPDDDERGTFVSELGFTHGVAGDLRVGSGTALPGLCVPGTSFPRAAVLLTIADVATGVQASLVTAPQVSVTADLTLQILRRPPTTDFEFEARVLKAGRTVSVGETTFTRAGETEPFAVSIATFMASPRPSDVFDRPFVPDGSPPPIARSDLGSPLVERVGLRTVEPGVAEIDRRPDLTNATNSIQGGLIALVAEIASETLVTADAGRPYIVVDLDVRYLRAARVGPARATSRLLSGDANGATCRVEVRDVGSDNRLVAHVIAQCAPTR